MRKLVHEAQVGGKGSLASKVLVMKVATVRELVHCHHAGDPVAASGGEIQAAAMVFLEVEPDLQPAPAK